MARQRFIHPEFWTDPTIGKLTPVERLFFIGCFSNADDEGRLIANPAYLRSVIFPYDDMSLKDVKAIRDRVVSICRNIVLYSDGENEYIAFTKWQKYQHPRYPQPSKLPPPPQELLSSNNATEALTQDCSTEALPQDCGNVAATLPQDCAMGLGLGLGLGMGKNISPNGDKSSPAAPAEDPSPSPKLLVSPARIAALWNEICADVLPRVAKLTEERRRKIRSRLVEDRRRDEAWWRAYFERIRASPFLRGENDRGWRADFDWAIRSETVVARVAEGRYDAPQASVATAAYLDLTEKNRAILARRREAGLIEREDPAP